MFGKAIATLIASVIEHTSMFCDTRLMLGLSGHVGPLAKPEAYTLRFPNKNVQAHFCLVTLCVFHVKL